MAMVDVVSRDPVYREAGERRIKYVVRRLQRKWKAEGEAYLAEARAEGQRGKRPIHRRNGMPGGVGIGFPETMPAVTAALENTPGGRVMEQLEEIDRRIKAQIEPVEKATSAGDVLRQHSNVVDEIKRAQRLANPLEEYKTATERLVEEQQRWDERMRQITDPLGLHRRW
jgi:FtsZ-binding cell division protein ZapB